MNVKLKQIAEDNGMYLTENPAEERGYYILHFHKIFPVYLKDNEHLLNVFNKMIEDFKVMLKESLEQPKTAS